MLRSTPRIALLTMCLFIQAGLASAQTTTTPQTQVQSTQPAPATQRPSEAPPQLERIEPGSDVPATTIPPRQGTRITEKRGNDGKVTEVEVQAGPSRYTMKPNVAPGNAQPGDISGSSIRAPQWQVMEFDFGNPKKKDAAEQPAAAAPARAGAAGTPARADVPPPPALEPTTKQ